MPYFDRPFIPRSLHFGANQGPNNGHGSYGGFHNQFQANENHYHPRVSGFQEQDFRVKSLILFSKFLVKEEVEARIMVEEVVEIQSQLVNSITHMVIQLLTATRDLTSYGQQEVVIHRFESQPQHSTFPLPASYYPSSRSQAYSNNQNHSSQVPYSGDQKGLTSYSQPSNSQIQGNLAYTSIASQNSGGHNSVSPIVTVSEKPLLQPFTLRNEDNIVSFDIKCHEQNSSAPMISSCISNLVSPCISVSACKPSNSGFYLNDEVTVVGGVSSELPLLLVFIITATSLGEEAGLRRRNSKTQRQQIQYPLSSGLGKVWVIRSDSEMTSSGNGSAAEDENDIASSPSPPPPPAGGGVEIGLASSEIKEKLPSKSYTSPKLVTIYLPYTRSELEINYI
ncbi:hypothetical protein FEM48_Zijuj07G0010200 [Ziziphus jujuba var. spinosa]|uniref:Uncharacterized protein n=1 Tax=Ziziphus jujuba var. spinosa TaxID=714518 RepID=A0A978V1I8_ZIZJJ|nr:hypothetical protein FEM48_Zijuj07G0010200 [Ziziphus jujuba var. spinosa]